MSNPTTTAADPAQRIVDALVAADIHTRHPDDVRRGVDTVRDYLKRKTKGTAEKLAHSIVAELAEARCLGWSPSTIDAAERVVLEQLAAMTFSEVPRLTLDQINDLPTLAKAAAAATRGSARDGRTVAEVLTPYLQRAMALGASTVVAPVAVLEVTEESADSVSRAARLTTKAEALLAKLQRCSCGCSTFVGSSYSDWNDEARALEAEVKAGGAR